MESTDILYIQKQKSFAMKGKQLLSIVFSVIMFIGVTAGSMAFAETDEYDDSYDDDSYDIDYVKDGRHYDLDDRLEYFCEMTDEEKRQFFEDHPRLEQFSDRLANYCDLSEDEREDAIDDFIREHVTDEDWDRNTDADFRSR